MAGFGLRGEGRALKVAYAAVLAALVLYAYPLCRPLLVQDDFDILTRSVTWEQAWNNLWMPNNEHAMPLGRLTTWLLIRAAGRITAIPFVCVLQGVVALVVGMGLVHFLVRRELGHPFYGLVAMILFGVTSVYQQAVYWFAASFTFVSLDLLLLALLAAQRWRQSGRVRHLVLCILWCLLAPAWFSTGLLAGPLCCLYLVGRAGGVSPRSSAPPGANAPGSPGLACSLLPLLGTVGFLMVSVPRTLAHVMHLEHNQGKTPVEAFELRVGITTAGRSLVENLTLGALGLGGIDLPLPVVVAVLLGLTAAGVWWWRIAPARQFLLIGLTLILATYVMAYGARAELARAVSMNQPNWSRYHLYPQLGLTLFVCGGLPHWQRRWGLDSTGLLSARQTRWLLLLIAVLFVLQLPRALLAHWPATAPPEEQLSLLFRRPADWLRWTWEEWRDDHWRSQQQAVLLRIEAMEERCRRHRVSAATALAALDRLDIPGSQPWDNGWDFLRGSKDPLPLGVDQVRALLTAPLAEPDH